MSEDRFLTINVLGNKDIQSIVDPPWEKDTTSSDDSNFAFDRSTRNKKTNEQKTVDE